MVFNPNVPKPADLLSVSQSDILTNFQQLDAVFDNDHYEFSFAGGAAAPYDIAVAADKGKHKQVTFVRASADIANAGTDELGLYNKNTGAGAQELFLRRESGGSVIQMTAGNPTNAANGFTFLPGGLLLQWGSVTLTAALTTVIFPTPFQAATVPYSITLTPQGTASTNNAQAVNTAAPPTNTSFNIGRVGSNITMYWMAIGVAP